MHCFSTGSQSFEFVDNPLINRVMLDKMQWSRREREWRPSRSNRHRPPLRCDGMMSVALGPGVPYRRRYI